MFSFRILNHSIQVYSDWCLLSWMYRKYQISKNMVTWQKFQSKSQSRPQARQWSPVQASKNPCETGSLLLVLCSPNKASYGQKLKPCISHFAFFKRWCDCLPSTSTLSNFKLGEVGEVENSWISTPSRTKDPWPARMARRWVASSECMLEE